MQIMWSCKFSQILRLRIYPSQDQFRRSEQLVYAEEKLIL